jgi:hypothetical protein
LESECEWEEHGQRKNILRKTVCHIFPIHFSCLKHCQRYNDEISLEDAIHTALLTLKEGFEGQLTEKTIEIGIVTVPTLEEQAALLHVRDSACSSSVFNVAPGWCK